MFIIIFLIIFIIYFIIKLGKGLDINENDFRIIAYLYVICRLLDHIIFSPTSSVKNIIKLEIDLIDVDHNMVIMKEENIISYGTDDRYSKFQDIYIGKCENCCYDTKSDECYHVKLEKDYGEVIKIEQKRRRKTYLVFHGSSLDPYTISEKLKNSGYSVHRTRKMASKRKLGIILNDYYKNIDLYRIFRYIDTRYEIKKEIKSYF